MSDLSDLTEITKLVNSYARLLDAGDVDAVAALFEHSTWRSAGGQVLRGSAAVKPVYDALKNNQGSSRTKHLLSNLTVEIGEGNRTARSHCYWTVLQATAPGEPTTVTLTGQYTDTFEKVAGRWRFSDRLITTDFTGDAPGQAN